MRRFGCERCGVELAFTDARCPQCNSELGYEPESRTLRALQPDGRAIYHTSGNGIPFWRCLNAAWGCNWLVPVDRHETWCRSCRLTRGRPDTKDSAAVQAWMTAEAAKRRIVHQLDEVGLPLVTHARGTAVELTFDLVHVPGQKEVTGHFKGVITLDLTEADELHRVTLRLRLHEAFRTLVGHIRHELGHFYMEELVSTADQRNAFRRVFGDERLDYAQSVRSHYECPEPDWQARGFITAYASAHPLEDWAESFAHYLAIRDGAETMVEHRLNMAQSDPSDWLAALTVWREGVTMMNAVAEGLGHGPVYPISITPAVVQKLSFVDECLRFRAGTTTAACAAPLVPFAASGPRP